MVKVGVGGLCGKLVRSSGGQQVRVGILMGIYGDGGGNVARPESK